MRTLKEVETPDPRWTVTALGISARIAAASDAHSSWMLPMPLRGSQKASKSQGEGAETLLKQKTPIAGGLRLAGWLAYLR